jgi:hypothetical protein
MTAVCRPPITIVPVAILGKGENNHKDGIFMPLGLPCRKRAWGEVDFLSLEAKLQKNMSGGEC